MTSVFLYPAETGKHYQRTRLQEITVLVDLWQLQLNAYAQLYNPFHRNFKELNGAGRIIE